MRNSFLIKFTFLFCVLTYDNASAQKSSTSQDTLKNPNEIVKSETLVQSMQQTQQLIQLLTLQMLKQQQEYNDKHKTSKEEKEVAKKHKSDEKEDKQEVLAASLPKYKNTIKFNVTNRLLLDNAYQLAYERQLPKNRSINVHAGYQEFPILVAPVLQDGYLVKQGTSRSGYSGGAEYRWYLPFENRYPAPHGIYVGAFASFSNFSTTRTLQVKPANIDAFSMDASLTSKINFQSLGISIGYQFIVKERWVLDFMFFGPSVTHYKIDLSLTADTEVANKDGILDSILEGISSKIPFFSKISDANLTKEDYFAAGFSYSVSVGYRF